MNRSKASLSFGPPPKPIFIVGSPRSGTSILTWCLGQHPDILPLEEGNWLDKFAFELGSTYEFGSQRGDRSQLAALGISRDEFYGWFGRAIDELVLGSAGSYMEHARSVARLDPSQIHPSFQLTRETLEPKSRWVDGTPEYSFCICGLRKLFPEAKFIHIVRDVRSVVRSLVRFGEGGRRAVASEREAYEYWLRTTQACLLAEEALGQDRMARLRYQDLVDDPERAMDRIFDFLGEPFCRRCLEPLSTRINSSRGPPGFESEDGTTPVELREQAESLSRRLQQPGDSAAARSCQLLRLETEFWAKVKDRNYPRLEAEFDKRAEWAVKLEAEVSARDETIRQLQDELRREIAARDETIRGYQDALRRRTIRNGLWRLWQLIKA
jgi:hypothetical protein